MSLIDLVMNQCQHLLCGWWDEVGVSGPKAMAIAKGIEIEIGIGIGIMA
jgi:hypothetical protein